MTWRQLDKGKAAVQVRLQSPALGAGFYLFSALGTQPAALLASTVCGANILSTVCMEYISFPVWIILSDDFALRVSKLQNCDFLLCKTEYKILDTGFYTERMRLILHLLKPS